MSDVYTWRNGHLRVCDAAQALFPRGRRTTTFAFSPPFGSERCKAFIGAAAKPSYSHSEWFAWSREARLERGRETRKRICEVLRDEGVLLEPGNHEPVAEWLVEAMEKAAQLGRPVYIKPGLTASPNFASVYREYGFTSAIRWANFRPALLKVTYRPRNTRKPWSLQVIDIKSTHPRAVEADKVSRFLPSRNDRSLTPLVQVHLQDQFRILAYRHFLAQIVENIKRDDYARQDFPLLRRLAISHICVRLVALHRLLLDDVLRRRVHPQWQGRRRRAYALPRDPRRAQQEVDRGFALPRVPTRVGVPCQHD